MTQIDEERDDKNRDGGFATGVSVIYERSEAGGYRDQWGWHDDCAPDEDEQATEDDADEEAEAEGEGGNEP